MTIKQPLILSINKIKQKIPVFLFIICTLITIVLGYLADINSLQKKLQQLQKQMFISQTQISQQDSLLKQIAKINAQYKILNNEYISHNIYNRSNIDLSYFLKDILIAAEKNHIEINAINPSKLTQNEHNATQIINIEFNGTYQQIVQFINSFAQLKLATYIQSLSIQKNTANEIDSKLTAKISLLLYDFYYKTTKLKATIKRDPFDQYQYINQAALSQLNSENLRLLGMFVQNNKNIGIVKDSEGFIHYFNVNETIGIHQNKIIKISADAIITDNPAENIYREN